jgi:hypothetical protein
MRTILLNPKRWSVRTLRVVGVLVALLLLSCSGLLPPQWILGWEDDVDIHSGRVRHACLVFCIPIVRYSVDSSLTNVLPEAERNATPPAWRTVMFVSPFVGISQHYAFHLAIGQINDLKRVWEKQAFAPECRRESARHLLRLWQRDENYFAADLYLLSLKKEGK